MITGVANELAGRFFTPLFCGWFQHFSNLLDLCYPYSSIKGYSVNKFGEQKMNHAAIKFNKLCCVVCGYMVCIVHVHFLLSTAVIYSSLTSLSKKLSYIFKKEC